MSTHATGTRTVQKWDEHPFSEVKEGPKLTQATVISEFKGDVEGKATQHLVMIYQSESEATYLSLEQVEGRIGERRGSFVLRHEGTYAGTVARTTWSVVPNSGTGDLKGLRGEGSYTATHGNADAPFTFDYDFE